MENTKSESIYMKMTLRKRPRWKMARKLDKDKKFKLDEDKKPPIFVCVADLEKQSEDIQIEFLRLMPNLGFSILEPVTVFKELPPRAISLHPFTLLNRDRSLSFSTIYSYEPTPKLYCVGGAAPSDLVTGYFSTIPKYKSVNRPDLYFYNSYKDVDRFHLFKPIREVFAFNLSDAKANEWKSLPPMSTGRCRPFILSRNGKIYVFGCRLTPLKDLHPFAEVFDPSTDQWTTLIDSVPPLLFENEPLFFRLNKPATTNCAFVENQTKVLVILSEEAISFTWPLESSIDSPSPYSSCPSVYSTDPIVVLEDIAFVFINSQKLYAYRLKNGMFDDDSPDEPTLVKKGFEEFEKFGSPTCPAFFFHLDHMDFCMVWQEFYPTQFCYLKFQIHTGDSDSLEDLFVTYEEFSSCVKAGKCSILSASM